MTSEIFAPFRMMRSDSNNEEISLPTQLRKARTQNENAIYWTNAYTFLTYTYHFYVRNIFTIHKLNDNIESLYIRNMQLYLFIIEVDI